VASAITGVATQRLVRRQETAGRVPMAAVLAPNDEWRDFIARNPGLTEIRRRIKDFPLALLPSEDARPPGDRTS
jgi:hypothetical protein